MEQVVIDKALKQYLKHKEAMKRYYEKNKEKMIKQITEARQKRNGSVTRPRGRPRGRKGITEEEFLKLGVKEEQA